MSYQTTAHSVKEEIKGRNITGASIRELRSLKIAYIPTERLVRGASLDSSVAENMMILNYRDFHSWGRLKQEEIEHFSGALGKQYNIKASPEDTLSQLSGGNIQKVILARELSAGKDFGLFSEPTWGIDAASTKFVHGEILALRDRGCAILLISTDLDEILALSDRVAVMHRGSIVAVYPNTEGLSKESIGLAMLGSGKDGTSAARPSAPQEQARC